MRLFILRCVIVIFLCSALSFSAFAQSRDAYNRYYQDMYNPYQNAGYENDYRYRQRDYRAPPIEARSVQNDYRYNQGNPRYRSNDPRAQKNDYRYRERDRNPYGYHPEAFGARNPSYGFYSRDERTFWGIRNVTIGGGPIISRHTGSNNFRETHGLLSAKIETENKGNWVAYVLSPNSVEKTSVGFGYVTDPYIVPTWGYSYLEFTGSLGLVTGYKSYPVPAVAGSARLSVYQNGPTDVGFEMVAMPYMAEDNTTKQNKFGLVATSPFLSIRYNFY